MLGVAAEAPPGRLGRRGHSPILSCKREDVVVAILLTVCLIGDPNTCRDYKITLVPGITLNQCLMTAPPHIAKWSEEHPGWHVERWRCGNASREDI
jgi:hypothetical protein